jgi:hypothetical protein
MFISRKKVQHGQETLVHALVISIATIIIYGCAAPLPKCSGDSPALDAKTKVYQAQVNSIVDLIDTREEFHDAALDTNSYTTQFPLYLFGIEKPRANSDTPYPLAQTENEEETPRFDITNLKASTDDRGDIEDVLDDPRSMVLTHALSIRRTDSKSNATSRKECFIYNIY